MGERSRSRYLVHVSFDLDAPDLIHRLRGVVAKVEDHLLQLSRLTGYDGCIRYLADRQFDSRRKRGMKQRARFGDQSFHTYWPTLYIPAPAKSEDLIDEIARPLSGTADFAEVAGGLAVRHELLFGHFGMAEDRADDIVEIVCDPAGESTDRFHAAGLLEICLQPGTFVQERIPDHDVGDRVESHAQ